MISQRRLGAGLMVLAVILFIIGFAYVRTAEAALMEGHIVTEGGACTHDVTEVCPFAQLNALAFPKYLALTVDGVIFLVGLLLFVLKTPAQNKAEKARSVKLVGDEARLFDLVKAADGMMYQHDIVAETSLSKVKVSRVLDRLEAKGLIERRRRGMTNAIILK